ncbi:MAG: HNH endonuclease [Gammaproteobacteria bacterium]|nr:HNH endonuclease [Gammaproteobacteria bacterium]
MIKDSTAKQQFVAYHLHEMTESSWDTKVRTRAFQWLDEVSPAHEDILPRALIQQGFELEGRQVHLMSPQGIFTPLGCEYPLSVTTVLNGPYPDRFEDAHRLSYRYRGKNPNHRDNVGLRNAMRNNVPLVYFFAVAQGRYQAIKPVYVTGDDPARLTFTIMADQAGTFEGALLPESEVADTVRTELRRQYATAAVQVRLHQASFRERVLDAYRTHCAMCRLKHRELLDAAHIIPDSDPDGHPEVSNGLALCKIHHAAFDRGIVGVRPDYVIEVREDVLKEVDGPMLKYGLQALHNSELLLPTRAADQPSKAALEHRYQSFVR